MDVLAAFYQERQVPYDRQLAIHPFGMGVSRLECQGVGLMPLLIRDEKQEKLREYQQEMREFTSFLKDRLGVSGHAPGGNHF